MVLDDDGTHRTALIHNWLARRTRFHLQFTPTSASWINLVERWFAEIASNRFDAVRSTAHANWSQQSSNILRLTMMIPNRSSGRKVQMTYWSPLKHTVNALLIQNTSNFNQSFSDFCFQLTNCCLPCCWPSIQKRFKIAL